MNEALAHFEDSPRADQRADARRSDHLDANAVETVSRVGDVAEGLRTGQNKTERSEADYINDNGAKLLRVLECFEGREWEPVTINRIASRSGFKRDAARRLITTLKKTGWAKELPSTKERLFVAGPKLENLARSLARAALGRWSEFG